MGKMFQNERALNLLIPVGAAILGLIAGGIVMIVSGFNPIDGYSALYEGIFGSPRNIGETIRAMTPLILAGLSVAFAFKTGLFNIGVEGQLLMGWFSAVYVGVVFDLPAGLHVIAAIIAAGVAGALWGFIPGLLKAKYKVNEVIVTIMMNYTALYVTNYLVKTLIYDKNEKTLPIAETASLRSEFFTTLTESSRMHLGIFVAILAAIIMWYFLEKTTYGYELKAVGNSRDAAQYAGMSVKKNIIMSMAIAGILAGIAGAMEGLGTYGNMTAYSAFTGIGFDGIAVALLGANNPFGIIVAAFLFGGLKTAAPQMNFNAGVPSELASIIIAFIVFFVASSYIIRVFFMRKKKGGN